MWTWRTSPTNLDAPRHTTYRAAHRLPAALRAQKEACVPTHDLDSADRLGADPDHDATLLAAAGLRIAADDLACVRALRARFARDRARLAAFALDDVEPLTIVTPAELAPT
jgi:hypothetical protein